MRHFRYSVIWQSLEYPGYEYCHLSSHDDGWQLKGTSVLVLDDNPVQVSYQVLCNHLWQTRTVNVVQQVGVDEQAMRIIVDKRHRWWVENKTLHKEIKELRGCIDIDLGITPATNSLPIRRVPLAIGQSIKLKAAWLRIPEFKFEPLVQKYTRLDEHRYRYESGHGDFTADLEVDSVGLVTYYPENWKRIAVQTQGELLYPKLETGKEH